MALVGKFGFALAVLAVFHTTALATDLTLRYNQPASIARNTSWEREALAIGNGRIGAMIFADPQRPLLPVPHLQPPPPVGGLLGRPLVRPAEGHFPPPRLSANTAADPPGHAAKTMAGRSRGRQVDDGNPLGVKHVMLSLSPGAVNALPLGGRNHGHYSRPNGGG
jgi:hypothetical protein